MTAPVSPCLAQHPTISAEFAFVCACAAPLHPPRTDDRYDDLDGDTLAAIAHRHQVVPLVVEALKRRGLSIPPALAACHDPLAPLRSAREAIRLHTLLIADGIELMFLKGSTLAMLAMLAYGAIQRRQFGDIDLLVRPTEAPRAARLLEDAGYRTLGGAGDLSERVTRTMPLAKDIAIRHPGNRQIVELHWRMTDNLHERPVRDREAIQWVELAPGAAVPTLATDALFAYVCNHGPRIYGRGCAGWPTLPHCWRANPMAATGSGTPRSPAARPARPRPPSCSPSTSLVRPRRSPSQPLHRSA